MECIVCCLSRIISRLPRKEWATLMGIPFLVVPKCVFDSGFSGKRYSCTIAGLDDKQFATNAGCHSRGQQSVQHAIVRCLRAFFHSAAHVHRPPGFVCGCESGGSGESVRSDNRGVKRPKTINAVNSSNLNLQCLLKTRPECVEWQCGIERPG